MRTVGNLVSYSAKYYPDKLATIYRDVRLTYSELNDRVNMVANGLLREGVNKGDRIGIICHTSHFFQEIFYGIAKTGAVATTINWRLAPRELEFVIDNADVSVLFVAEQYWPNVEATKDKLTKVKSFILIGGPVVGTINYEEFIRISTKDEIDIDIARDDDAWQLYTSGTTGQPKGVVLTHKNILSDAERFMIAHKCCMDDMVWLHLFPTFHVAAHYIFVVAYVHATVVLMDNSDVEVLCETIEKEKCTHLHTVPATWQNIVDYPDIDKYDLSSLVAVGYGGAPMPIQTAKKIKEKISNIKFFETYGLTEAGSVLTVLTADQAVTEGPDYLLKRLGSLGRPQYGVDVRIVDNNDKDCPPGVVGEIIGRSDSIMKGYWKLPEETANTLKNGWLYTGDMGYWDEYGYIYMADRKKDLIISGGENIYPKEVENVIKEIKGIADVVVIGIPDDKWGEAVKAVVIKEPDAEVTEDDVINYCAKNIAGYKKPKSVDFVAEFPRNVMGKIFKKDIRSKYWKGKGRNV